MYKRMKLKLTVTTILSFLLGVVQSKVPPRQETSVGQKSVTLGPCKNEEIISDSTNDENTLKYKVWWEVHQNSKKTHINIDKHHNNRFGLLEMYKESHLEIKDVRKSDAGLYICKMSIDGKTVKLAEVELIVKFRPELVPPTYSHTLKEGETCEIWCNATGIPIPKIEWFRVAQVDSETQDEKIGASGNMLRIHNITRYARGTYRCHASNEVGYAVGTFNVDVTFPAELKVLQEELKRNNTDTNVKMVCAVTSNPMAKIDWYKGNEKEAVKLKEFKYQIEEDIKMQAEYYTIFSSLKITSTLDQEDFDIYYCEAQYDSGNVSKTVQLVRYPEE